jgi:hypothetical protein
MLRGCDELKVLYEGVPVAPAVDGANDRSAPLVRGAEGTPESVMGGYTNGRGAAGSGELGLG